MKSNHSTRHHVPSTGWEVTSCDMNQQADQPRHAGQHAHVQRENVVDEVSLCSVVVLLAQYKVEDKEHAAERLQKHTGITVLSTIGGWFDKNTAALYAVYQALTLSPSASFGETSTAAS
jgi:hypothetical protein